MSYRKKYSKGFGGGYGGYKSGYMGQKDPLAAYRHTSPPMSEYDRKIRNRLEKPEVNMSGNFEVNANLYKQNFARPQETGLSQKEVDELSDKILHSAIEEFKKINNATELPQEKYEVARDTADDIAQRMTEIRSDPDDKTTTVDFAREFLGEPETPWHSDILEEVDKIRNRMEELKAETLEVRDSLPEFEHLAEEMKKADELFSGSGTPSETIPADRIMDHGLEPDFTDMTSMRKRREDLYGDSEI